MATATVATGALPPPALPAPGALREPDLIWRAPLVPLTLAATAGGVLDRTASVPLPFTLIALAAGLAAWLAAWLGRQTGLGLVYLLFAVAALGAAWHHLYRNVYRGDDLGAFATADGVPAQVRGFLDEEPARFPTSAQPALHARPVEVSTWTVLQVRQLHDQGEWLPIAGRTRLIVRGDLKDVHAGDEVEVVGRLMSPPSAMNPGGDDRAARLRDQRIRSELVVTTPAGVTRLEEGWSRSLSGWLAAVRGWGERQINRDFPERTRGLALALLLGNGTAMNTAQWDKYKSTGVVHVLAISGQHLAVLGWFLWAALRAARVRQRWGVMLVAAVLFAYALVTGGRPSALRAAVLVTAFCLAVMLRRPVLPANSFAAAWLVIGMVNPTDLFTIGCQLSFLAAAVLIWGPIRWPRPDDDPLRRLVEASRPAWQRGLRRFGWLVVEAYWVTLLIWLAVTPLAASQMHAVAPVGLVLGPPVVLLTSVGLVAGFLYLLVSAVAAPLGLPFLVVTDLCLFGTEWLVNQSLRLAGPWYVGAIPAWWLWGYYGGQMALVLVEPIRRRWRWAVPAALAWLCVGLLSGARPGTDELRCTFLAVGHGGCTVIETPDGRTLLYDVGAIAGPEVTRYDIAPYLWSRGIRRIDEVILSHADLDHFNGLPALLERFAVAQVTCSPSFEQKPTAGVDVTLAALTARRVPLRTVQAGVHLSAGDVDLEVLHPPAQGLEGNENARSLVLLVRHAGHTILLTGDLEGPGLTRVLKLPATKVDVMMAPHHGSPPANPVALVDWARPRVVVVCRERQEPRFTRERFTDRGAEFLSTGVEGAVTVRSHTTGLIVETYATKRRLVVRR